MTDVAGSHPKSSVSHMAEDIEGMFKKLQGDLFIDDALIDRELSQQAAVFSFVAQCHVEAERAYEEGSAKWKQVEAKMRKHERKRIEAYGSKATEGMINEAVLSTEEYGEWQSHLSFLKWEKDKWKALRDSWSQRKDALLNLSYNKRAEMQNQVQTATAREKN